MTYLIVGTIIALIGVGFMMNNFRLLGMIVALIGAAFGLKGRKEIDKFKGGKDI